MRRQPNPRRTSASEKREKLAELLCLVGIHGKRENTTVEQSVYPQYLPPHFIEVQGRRCTRCGHIRL